MRRADRHNSSDDNSSRNPHSRQPEPASYHELKSSLMTARAQRDEWQQRARDTEEQVEQNHHLYLEAQQKHQSALTLYQEEQQKHQTTFTLYQDEQQKYQTTFTLYQEAQTQAESYLTLYSQEKASSSELLIKFETAQIERDHYLTLYNEAQTQLKFERRSKAGIKSWETRRKRENERLKQEIGEMAVLLRDSLERKDEAVDNLYALASRMDRIQQLVDSVEDESSNNPLGLVQKFKRIWQAVKDILAE
ncbi:hypothetical protein H6F93_07365 [Leptolyngbya sp. FACHB-671]|uniref:hypothetical protein n=1 Tax=Leptolyngbya sp. FACHB-671 TaxID=2692812 RepID=UPI00168A2A43|nr:hypothetical protein [Leptolyngbya sp. FACHB-671]MBD2067348.1 hypothetical protein [Leptolyngbya sp. FACHB-671]